MTDASELFEETLKEYTQMKNIPNNKFADGVFQFSDYFDPEAFEESIDQDIDNLDEWVNWAFEPYDTYFSGVPEVEAERSEEDRIIWMNVAVEIPDDVDRARLLASLVGNAVEQRRLR